MPHSLTHIGIYIPDPNPYRHGEEYDEATVAKIWKVTENLSLLPSLSELSWVECGNPIVITGAMLESLPSSLTRFNSNRAHRASHDGAKKRYEAIFSYPDEFMPRLSLITNLRMPQVTFDRKLIQMLPPTLHYLNAPVNWQDLESSDWPIGLRILIAASYEDSIPHSANCFPPSVIALQIPQYPDHGIFAMLPSSLDTLTIVSATLLGDFTLPPNLKALSLRYCKLVRTISCPSEGENEGKDEEVTHSEPSLPSSPKSSGIPKEEDPTVYPTTTSEEASQGVANESSIDQPDEAAEDESGDVSDEVSSNDSYDRDIFKTYNSKVLECFPYHSLPKSLTYLQLHECEMPSSQLRFLPSRLRELDIQLFYDTDFADQGPEIYDRLQYLDEEARKDGLTLPPFDGPTTENEEFVTPGHLLPRTLKTLDLHTDPLPRLDCLPPQLTSLTITGEWELSRDLVDEIDCSNLKELTVNIHRHDFEPIMAGFLLNSIPGRLIEEPIISEVKRQRLMEERKNLMDLS